MNDREVPNDRSKVTIIGAGPIGMACAIELKKRGISSLLFDKGAPLENMRNWPLGMRFYSSADKLSLGGIPFISDDLRPTREEALRYYLAVANHFGLDIHPNTRVLSLNSKGEIKSIETNKGRYHATEVILATGYYDHPRMLSVPGETLPHVSHYLHDPFRYAHSRVLIVGGSHSAVDAALMLYRAGAEVHILHRGDRFSEKLKYWVRPDLENRIKEGHISVHFQSKIAAIKEREVLVSRQGESELMKLECDFVLLLTGYEPDIRLMEMAGIEVDPLTRIPALNPETLESNVEGIYVAGSLTAGRNLSKVFIENGREHAKRIARAIAGT